ncbi:mitochondrial ribosomal protein L11 [Aureococcus anophagefferens]|uniref:Mitochondrial ribosomal protein L11 n=1 Tax=Aureococcus anophagefferens TaxID=44056 RepID=A0ABR1FSC2_AURAN
MTTVKAVVVRLRCPAGVAKAGPAIGQALGPHGLNMMEFVKAFNAATQKLEPDTPIPVVLTARSGSARRAQRRGRDRPGAITLDQIRDIAEVKHVDKHLAHIPFDALCESIKGTAFSMGAPSTRAGAADDDDDDDDDEREDDDDEEASNSAPGDGAAPRSSSASTASSWPRDAACSRGVRGAPPASAAAPPPVRSFQRAEHVRVAAARGDVRRRDGAARVAVDARAEPLHERADGRGVAARHRREEERVAPPPEASPLGPRLEHGEHGVEAPAVDGGLERQVRVDAERVEEARASSAARTRAATRGGSRPTASSVEAFCPASATWTARARAGGAGGADRAPLSHARSAGAHLRGNQIFNPTSMCA